MGLTRSLRRRALALVTLLLICTAGGACVALAQAPSPPGLPGVPASDPGQTSVPGIGNADTWFTPAAVSDQTVWRQVAGAKYTQGSAPVMVAGSTTPDSTDFFAVSMRDDRNGLAGGSDLVSCGGAEVWVPVIYRYRVLRSGDGVWEPSLASDCASGRGFVGSIAWLGDSGEAIAVGGDGTYPRRESSTAIDAAGYQDPAGHARVWLFDGSSWQEMHAPDLPASASGLTAVAIDPHDPNSGFAGGLGQMWRFSKGRFTQEWDQNTDRALPDQQRSMHGAPWFVFRVRKIVFVPGTLTSQAFAVTAGCCLSDPALDTPRVLGWDGSSWWVSPWGYSPTFQGWSALTLADAAAKGNTLEPTGESLAQVNSRPDIPDSFYDIMTEPNAGSVGGSANPGVPFTVSLLAAPGGPATGTQPASRLTQSACVTSDGTATGNNAGGYGSSRYEGIASLDVGALFLDGSTDDPAAEALRASISSAWLVAAGGDVERVSLQASQDVGTTPSRAVSCSSQWSAGDGVPDWAVGELGSTVTDRGAEGLAFSSFGSPLYGPDGAVAPPDTNHPTNYRPDPVQAASWLRSHYFLLSSYSLNAVSFAPGSATGWAVGDHGAILVHDGAAAAAGISAEPPPPALGPSQAVSAPRADLFDEFQPLGSEAVGLVPPLGAMPLEHLAAPELVGAGAPDPAGVSGQTEDVRQIVMSRDGSEGWAIGPSLEAASSLLSSRTSYAPSLYHFAGGHWSRCDQLGLGAQSPADPACAAVGPLHEVVDGQGNHYSVALVSAARVPWENGSDPSQRDRFEVVAIGSVYPDSRSHSAVPQPAILDYRDGRWSVVDWDVRAPIVSDPNGGFPLAPVSVAFDAPDDGWILMRATGSPAGRLYHFDGSRWSYCVAGSSACGADTESLVARFAAPTSSQSQGVIPNGVTAAGRRMFIYGYRVAADGSTYPFIASRDLGGAWSVDATKGGLDPGDPAAAVTPSPNDVGWVDALAVTPVDGGFDGWATGAFGGTVTSPAGFTTLRVGSPNAVALRLVGGRWQRFDGRGTPLNDYIGENLSFATSGQGASNTNAVSDDPTLAPVREWRLALVPGADGARAFVAQSETGRLLSFDPGTDRWSLVRAERGPGGGGGDSDFALDSPVQAVAPDGHGGLWVAVRGTDGNEWWKRPGAVYFFDYTDEIHHPVFVERPGPGGFASERYTGLAGDGHGRAWLATGAGVVYRYDRVLGWDRVRVDGWDPSQFVTSSTEATAVAVNDSGVGLVVGLRGRIADIRGASVALDSVSGTSCAASAPAGACGTGRDLLAAAVAPDGSALVGGSGLALLWRPAGGSFRAVNKPDASVQATITAITMPTPDAAWLAMDTGEVFAGHLDGTDWHWSLENTDLSGSVLNRGRDGTRLALRAIAVDAGGRGFAVGDQGLVLERDPTGAAPWRRVDTGFLDDLTAVSLTPGGGALIGGHNGLILTLVDGRLQVAHEAGFLSAQSGELTGPVVGFAVAGGSKPGEVEAWSALAAPPAYAAGQRDNGINVLLHYSSDSSDSLLDPSGRVQPLPDSPPVQHGEVRFAAFGDTGCGLPELQTCREPGGTLADNEVITKAVTDAISASAHVPGGPQFALFTGDSVGDTSLPGSDTVDQQLGPGAANFRGPVKLRRWRELVADPLWQAGVPLYAAVGARDLSSTNACLSTISGCYTNAYGDRLGESTMWRTAFASMPVPWGQSAQPAGVRTPGGLTLVPVSGGAMPTADQARTHYALDVMDGSHVLVRVVVIDTSLRSLAGGEAQANQNPVESQISWLEQTLSSRPAGAKAVVLSNSPTYTYGPGGQTTEIDATTLETILLRERVSVLVSGRIGWNALYYTLGPGLHYPCQGGSYPSGPGSVTSCAPTGGSPASSAAQDVLANALGNAGSAPDPASLVNGQGVTGAMTNVIAASSGSGFGPDNSDSGSASNGFWHGYTVIRIEPDGGVAVEQRPVLDWVTIQAAEHTLQPGQHMLLHGVGREPVGISSGNTNTLQLPTPPSLRYDEIDSPAITHRYDLVEADPARPWLPKVDPGSPAPNHYVPLDPSVATVDRETGFVRAGSGSHPRVYAIAILSVGDQAASWPIAFEPSRAFVQRKPTLPQLPPVIPPPALPPVHLAAAAPTPPPPPSSAPPTPPEIGSPMFPQLPGLSPPPPVAAVAPPAPPPPPNAPPPPAQPQPLPLALQAKLSPVGINATVVPPSPPPVNPAPPSGSAARKEAKQRQAATAKSEEGGAEQARDAGVDLAGGPRMPEGTAQMTRNSAPFSRRDRDRPQPSITPMARSAQLSAWTRDLLYGGGISGGALLLAFGFATIRPRSRRRSTPAPARAWARSR